VNKIAIHRQRGRRQNHREAGRRHREARHPGSSGNSPNIFFACMLMSKLPSDGALFGVFINQGEVCSAGSRILVQNRSTRNFRRRHGREGEENQARCPPIAKPKWSGQQRPVRSRSLLSGKSGKRKPNWPFGGARAEQFAKGYYVQPTIFYDVDNSARIAREEISVPWPPSSPSKTQRRAVSCNDSPMDWRLPSGTRDISKAFLVRCARASCGSITCSLTM